MEVLVRSHFQLLVVAALAVAVASPAWAVPAKFTQQGRLLDTSGQPLTGTHGLFFALYDAETGGAQQWSEYHSVIFDNGYYTVTLGEQNSLDDLLFSGAGLWLDLSVDGVALTPRQELASVPWALRAISAERVDGGVVDAAELSINGTQVITSSGTWVGPTPSVDWSDLSGVPADIADGDQDTQVTEAEVDAFVANNGYSTGAHTVDTNTQLTNAQVAAAALAEGFVTGPHTVNTDTQLTEAQVDTMVANNGYLAPDSSGNVGIGTANANELLTVAGIIESTSGGVKFPDGSTQLSAASGVPGTIIYTRCAWTVARGDTIGSCTPPTCPASWTDLGVNGNIKTDAYCGGGNSCASSSVAHSSGYQERACHTVASRLVMTPRCAWTVSRGDTIGTCTPSVCPSGWTDLGVTGHVKMSTYCGSGNSCASSSVAHSSGYDERTCTF